ncbi:hypothetical protein LTS18_000957, partial [Coniosporium uncinatum]
MHEKAILWDERFADFERNFFPSEKDIRRLAALQLKKIFLDHDEATVSIPSIEESNETQPDEKSGMDDDSQDPSLAIRPSPSHISEEDAEHMLSSVVEQQHAKDASDASTAAANEKESAESEAAIASDSPESVVGEAPMPVDVRHLDLAISPPSARNLSVTTMVPMQALLSEPEIGRRQRRNVWDAESPISASSRETSTSRAASPLPGPAIQITDSTPESRIPRPVDMARREGSPHPVPLIRTHSQPQPGLGLSRRQPFTTGVGPSSILEQASGVTKLEATRASITESAKALEKRLPERLGLGTIKFSRSGTHSLIPRSVPSKKTDSKVSSLAKHFEQLS